MAAAAAIAARMASSGRGKTGIAIAGIEGAAGSPMDGWETPNPGIPGREGNEGI